MCQALRPVLQIWPLISSLQHHHSSHFTGRSWTKLPTLSQLVSASAKMKRIDLANHLCYLVDDVTLHPDTQAGNSRMYLPPIPVPARPRYLHQTGQFSCVASQTSSLFLSIPNPCLGPGTHRLFVCLCYFVFTKLN